MRIFHPLFIKQHRSQLNQYISELLNCINDYQNFILEWTNVSNNLLSSNQKFKVNTYIDSYISNVQTKQINRTVNNSTVSTIVAVDKNFLSSLNYTQVITQNTQNNELLKYFNFIQNDFKELFRVNFEISVLLKSLQARLLTIDTTISNYIYEISLNKDQGE